MVLVAAMALFVVVLIGAVLALNAGQPSGHQSVAGADSAQSSVAAFQNYRQGERSDLTAPSAASADQLYRQGERSDLTAPSAANAYQLYRQGERGDLSGNSAPPAR